MCGKPVDWSIFDVLSEPERRATYDDEVFAKAFYPMMVWGTPHSYPKEKSIGYFFLEIRAAEEARMRQIMEGPKGEVSRLESGEVASANAT